MIKEQTSSTPAEGPRKARRAGAGLMQRTCLKPQYSLHMQMFLSFGIVSATAIVMLMLAAIATTAKVGDDVTARAKRSLETQAVDSLGSSTRHVAETIAKKLDGLEGLASIMIEVTRDRFVGYPNGDGYGDDADVPFFDMDSWRNVYPLNSSSVLPLDWEIESNLNDDNYQEHVQGRRSWYGDIQDTKLSTATAMYLMQGQCDPSVTDPSHRAYHPNCTSANNDVRVGGAVQPTPTSWHIARKAADMSFVLKPLYEYHTDVRTLAVFFANSGAGSGIQFPALVEDGTTNYTSIGCDWMDVPNPRNSSSKLATREEIDRCHPNGTVVPSREYNPLERGWCREQALNPDKSFADGPYLDALSDHLWLMTFGRAVYDRLSNELIACILIDVTIDRITEITDSANVDNTSSVALVRWDDRGTVVASSDWDLASADSTATVSDLADTIGMDEALFLELKALVNFSSVWDADEVREAFDQIFYGCACEKLVSAFLIPIPPDKYDPAYSPDFMVIMSVDEAQTYGNVVRQTEREIQSSEMSCIRYTLVVGLAGMGAVLIFILVASFHLTNPLNWLDRTAKVIVHNFGYGLDKVGDLDLSGYVLGRCSPNTEINTLVKEFRKMVLEFSGRGSAAIVKEKVVETPNPFEPAASFRNLYESRKNDDFKYSYHSTGQDASCGKYLFDTSKSPSRYNSGPNIREDKELSAVTTRSRSITVFRGQSALSSPLFRWIVGLVVTPLMVTMITISILVILEVVQEPSVWLVNVRQVYFDQALRAIESTATLRASYAAEVMKQPVRDLHIYTRVAGWLLFGGLRRSDSFTEMVNLIENCTNLPDRRCGNRKPSCDCDWYNLRGVECDSYCRNDTRYHQTSFYSGLSEDAWPNGDRNSTSFPMLAYSPETTEWWGDVGTLPGHTKGPLASGYETTYDRLRVFSALSSIEFPLYNYPSNEKTKIGLATFVGFEADGMFVGYRGSDNEEFVRAKWRSSESNGAAILAPSLCPVGKYGYDCRCRGWYAHTRERHEKEGSLLYVTPPYQFASSNMTAQSCSYPLVDPKTNKLVGVSLVDFLPHLIIESLEAQNTRIGPGRGSFPILITSQADASGSDTVVGPDFSIGDPAVPIADKVLPHDDCSDRTENCKNRRVFEVIVRDMRSGNSNTTEFVRSRADGSQEKVHISYAPVITISFDPTDHSDFTRGVEIHNSSVFSLALALPESDLFSSFTIIEEDIKRALAISVAVFITLMVLTVSIVVYISARVTVSVTRPVNYLLEVVRKINCHDIEDDIPMINGGSREVVRVYKTFEKLYKVIRVANSAFFVGDLAKAYKVLNDALTTFTQLGDKKAIGIANNNLGNTMLGMYDTMSKTGCQSTCMMSKEDVIAKGIAYFDHAIKLGEEDMDRTNNEVGWSNTYLVFMQQLSNRYFNRAIFLLTVSQDHPHPEDAETQGLRDLTIAKDMDTEVFDQRVEAGLRVREDEHFELVLGRLNGLIRLKQMSYSFDWELNVLVDDAISQLTVAMTNSASPLFRDIGPVGRMQQLDSALIDFIMCTRNDITQAAQVGIRMLVEDEYVLPDAALKAINALVVYMHHMQQNGESICVETLQRVLQCKDTLQHGMQNRIKSLSSGDVHCTSVHKSVLIESF